MTKKIERALGTVQLGMPYGHSNKGEFPTLPAALDILNYAFDHNIRFYDTARAYGEAEYRLGLFFRERGMPRNSIKVSTKIAPISLSSSDPAGEVTRSLEDSLKALNVEFIDVLMFHRWVNWQQPNVQSALSHFEKHFRQLGVSISNPTELLEVLNEPRVSFVQLPCHILDWRWREPHITEAIRRRPDVHFQCRSVFLQGFLISQSPSPVTGYDPTPLRDQVQSLTEQWQRQGTFDTCYAYVQALPWMGSLVFGVDNLEQLKSNLSVLDLPPLEPYQVQEVSNQFTRLNVPDQLLNPSQWKEPK